VNVLVVDDSAAVRARMVALLREAGLDVVGEAGTAAAALAEARSLRPQAIVLDLQLPDGNGLDILPALKAGGALIVVLTNSADEPVRSRCLLRGADYFFDKSKDFDAVARVIAASSSSP
jgi:DNA-binding NarL/FixJ family response regulator